MLYVLNIIPNIITILQIYVDTMNTFETPLPKLQYLDLSAVFIPVESK